MSQNILLCGVGGQGILLAAKIIASAAEASGLEVSTNEIHGMAQRGGSVTAQIKFGDSVASPLILQGSADVIGSLEEIEALRYAHYLRPEGFAAVSLQRVIPVTVSSGAAVYPQDASARLQRVFPHLVMCDCAAKALEFGDSRLANTILLGIISRALPLPSEAWQHALSAHLKPHLLNLNLNAFQFGKDFRP